MKYLCWKCLTWSLFLWRKKTTVHTITERIAPHFIKIRMWLLWKCGCKSLDVYEILFSAHTSEVRWQKLCPLPLCLITFLWFDEARKCWLILKCVVPQMQQGLSYHSFPMLCNGHFWELRVCLEIKQQQILPLYFW